MTGEGCWIDSSQVETGIYLTGTSILDYSANGRRWSRYGNRSPYKPAAPRGAYRCDGTRPLDRRRRLYPRPLARPPRHDRQGRLATDERFATLDCG